VYKKLNFKITSDIRVRPAEEGKTEEIERER
jgi:hypothetical protein